MKVLCIHIALLMGPILLSCSTARDTHYTEEMRKVRGIVKPGDNILRARDRLNLAGIDTLGPVAASKASSEQWLYAYFGLAPTLIESWQYSAGGGAGQKGKHVGIIKANGSGVVTSIE